MGDFYQTGVISTLHRFGTTNIDRLEKELKKYTRASPVALVLPCLYSELKGEAMPKILEELKKVAYLKEIVVSLGQTNEEEFNHAKEFFAPLPQEKKIIWNTGPRIKELYKLLEDNGISAGPEGKGRSVWMAFGYVLANEKSDAIVLHDCDILTYTREILARLCYPVCNMSLAYEYAKGYYYRVTDRMYGRVTRLLVTPLVRTLQNIVGYLPYLVFLDSFRYPLAGEFAITTDLARVIRIPGDWGLEIGILGEVFRNCAVRRVCEVDICETYEHKHQPLGADDPNTGLMKMAVDIVKSLFRTLAAERVVISEGLIRSLKTAYLRMAQDAIKRYTDDSAINGLFFDRHAEETAVENFAKAIDIGGKQVLEDPLGTPLIPNWTRVISAIPDILDRLKLAVDQDNQ
jgi:glucosyl-3-phosphoglycerate synthase